MLLQTTAHGRDSLGVEPEPVHSSGVARVLNFEAAIHDHYKAAILRDARTFFVDHRELAPQALGADGDSVPRDPGERRGGAENIDDIDGHRHLAETRVAPLAEDLRLARIHGNH